MKANKKKGKDDKLTKQGKKTPSRPCRNDMDICSKSTGKNKYRFPFASRPRERLSVLAIEAPVREQNEEAGAAFVASASQENSIATERNESEEAQAREETIASQNFERDVIVRESEANTNASTEMGTLNVPSIPADADRNIQPGAFAVGGASSRSDIDDESSSESFFHAEVLDGDQNESDEPSLVPAKLVPTVPSSRRKCCQVGILVLCLIIILLAVVLGVTVSGKKNAADGLAESTPLPLTISTFAPTVVPTEPVTMGPAWPSNCFTGTDVFLDAVDEYFADNSPKASVAQTWGWPIGNWCVSRIEVFDSAFSANRNPSAVAFVESLAGWDTSRARSMSNMFSGAVSFNQDLSTWDVSKVTNMAAMFSGASAFNQDLSPWDVSRVTNMESMFRTATSFNHNISSWNVSGVSMFRSMFAYTSEFDQDLSRWSLMSAHDLSFMFYYATSFNQDVSSWDVSHVSTVRSMFQEAIFFNQDVSVWNVRGILDFTNMFNGAMRFNQDLCAWGVAINSSTAKADSMFADTNCPTEEAVDLLDDPPGPFCVECR